MISLTLLKRFYPDDRPDNTQAFYAWVRSCLSPWDTVLNLGAGRPTGNPIRSLRGEAARVVGADIDPAVLDNDEMDDAHVIVDGVLPFADETFDLVISDFVFEHVGEPLPFLREARRVMKPGASLFFRTPNKYHYVSLIASLTPLWFHRLVANRARGLPADAVDQHPTVYLMNTRPELRRLATASGFRDIEMVMFEAHPAYLLFHPIPFLMGVAYERLVNRFEFLAGARANILGKWVK